MRRLLTNKVKTVVLMLAMVCGEALHAQTISPYLYGQNHWLADGDEGRVGYLQDLWSRVGESGVKIVRIGGNGYERSFPDRTHLNKMVDDIKSIGAEPTLQIPRQFSDLEVKELVSYYTVKGKRQIKFWSIGNEPMLHDEETIAAVHDYIVRIARVMRKAAPDIKIFIYDEAWLRIPEYRELMGGKLDVTGLRQGGKWLIDGITFHSYPNGPTFVRDDVVLTGPKKILDQITELQTLLQKANAKYKRKGSEALLWGLTEFNVTYHNNNREVSGYGNPSFLGGQFFAEIFGYAMQYSAYMVNPWCISETDAVATDFGYLGLPREFYPRSSYYHMQMMSSHLLGEFIGSADNHDYVKVIATSDKNTIAVMVLNQDQHKDFSFSMGFAGVMPKANHPLTISVNAKLEKMVDGKISAQTTKLFIFDKAGELQKTVTYSLQLNLDNKPPVAE